jgi:hypothetical protein
MDELTQNLVPGEQLLFSTEKVNIKPHLTQAQKLAGARVASQRDVGGARVIDINGAMAITDRRIFVIGMEGVFSKKPVLKFEAIYDSGYAKTLIESTKAKNEEITQQAQGMGMFARGKFMKEQGYSATLKILTGVEPQKSLFGGEGLVLQIFTLHMSELGQKGKNIGRKLGKVFSWGTFDVDKPRFELRIKQPLGTMKIAAESVIAASHPVLYEIVKRYAGKTNVTYAPLVDIMQAEAQEIAGLLKEFEESAA